MMALMISHRQSQREVSQICGHVWLDILEASDFKLSPLSIFTYVTEYGIGLSLLLNKYRTNSTGVYS